MIENFIRTNKADFTLLPYRSLHAAAVQLHKMNLDPEGLDLDYREYINKTLKSLHQACRVLDEGTAIESLALTFITDALVSLLLGLADYQKSKEDKIFETTKGIVERYIQSQKEKMVNNLESTSCKCKSSEELEEPWASVYGENTADIANEEEVFNARTKFYEDYVKALETEVEDLWYPL